MQGQIYQNCAKKTKKALINWLYVTDVMPKITGLFIFQLHHKLLFKNVFTTAAVTATKGNMAIECMAGHYEHSPSTLVNKKLFCFISEKVNGSETLCYSFFGNMTGAVVSRGLTLVEKYQHPAQREAEMKMSLRSILFINRFIEERELCTVCKAKKVCFTRAQVESSSQGFYDIFNVRL